MLLFFRSSKVIIEKNNSHVFRFVFNLSDECPSFDYKDCFGCRHATSVALSILRKVTCVGSIKSVKEASELLTQTLVKDPETVFSYEGSINYLHIIFIIGWQPIPLNWLIKKGYMAVYFAGNTTLRLFSIKKKTEDSRLSLFCHICARKTKALCFHIENIGLEERNDLVLDSYSFEFDNDSETDDFPQEKYNDLVSQESYPCKLSNIV